MIENINTEFTWESSVRGYELDNQGIVNNANYLHYFNNARLLCLNSIGINWHDWHTRGFDLVLVKASLTFHKPLREFDKFSVISTFYLASKLKISFQQKIHHKTTKILCASADTISTCISRDTGKPIFNKELYTILSRSNTDHVTK